MTCQRYRDACFPLKNTLLRNAWPIFAANSIAAEARAAVLTVAEEHSLSAATAEPLEVTPSLAARAEFAPAPSAATAVAERNGVFPRAEAPASAGAALTAEAVMAVADAIELTQLYITMRSLFTVRTEN